ncbi:MAG: hypothetical protein L3K26_17810, partial [Candidatus Hydrogenedentes bacterium]|nr:hypothetical protein [Candidatus Hydrogenedentota bacterium]
TSSYCLLDMPSKHGQGLSPLVRGTLNDSFVMLWDIRDMPPRWGGRCFSWRLAQAKPHTLFSRRALAAVRPCGGRCFSWLFAQAKPHRLFSRHALAAVRP